MFTVHIVESKKTKNKKNACYASRLSLKNKFALNPYSLSSLKYSLLHILKKHLKAVNMLFKYSRRVLKTVFCVRPGSFYSTDIFL